MSDERRSHSPGSRPRHAPAVGWRAAAPVNEERQAQARGLFYCCCCCALAYLRSGVVHPPNQKQSVRLREVKELERNKKTPLLAD